MDKEKLSRRRSSNYRESLPPPPPDPQQHSNLQKKSGSSSSLVQKEKALPEAFNRLVDYKEREASFLKTLNETIASDCRRLKSESDKLTPIFSSNSETNIDYCKLPTKPPKKISISQSTAATLGTSSTAIATETSTASTDLSDCDLLREECENFIGPLLNRTGPSVSAALVAYDAFEQLSRLHVMLDQILHIQEQNYKMRQYLRDVQMLTELKKLQRKEVPEHPQQPNEGDASDAELDLENQASLLSTILAAGQSASTKRTSAKRHRERSKSVVAEDIQLFVEKDHKPVTQFRRQSAFSEGKSKVSKWTKVKAAFKWERANVPALNESKSADSGIGIGIGLLPNNTEVARYLSVPINNNGAGSSADSVLSSSSGHLLSGVVTPGTISSASSIEDIGARCEDIRRDSSKSDSRCDSRVDEECRRSYSLDCDSIIVQSGVKNKTPWKKVKTIIQTHSGSFKGKTRSYSVKSNTSEKQSRDPSPCGSIDAASYHCEEHQTDPILEQKQRLHQTSSSQYSHESGQSSPNSPIGQGPGYEKYDNDFGRLMKAASTKGSRKSRIQSDFESLPEDTIVDLRSTSKRTKPPPSPLNLNIKHDLSDAEFGESSYSPTIFLKSPTAHILKNRRVLTPGNSSVPSSPSRHSEFFGEFESEDLSSGDFSEPTTPAPKISVKNMYRIHQEEINERFDELREKLRQEFDQKRQEWNKIRLACTSNMSCALHVLQKDEHTLLPKLVPEAEKQLEENLKPDFKKKLHKWRVKKQISIPCSKESAVSPTTKEGEHKKIDWNLWKTGQIKLDGQGLTPMPDQKNLPEDFQKKLEQWNRMKETSNDSLKRHSKSGGSIKTDVLKIDDKCEREKRRPDRDKMKSHDKDKLEKLSKLKAIVTDPRAKEIEVQTSVGVMKFEGISRKFTRKLYEWEKARGIGPESSTFALLHPGYRPLDVNKVAQKRNIHENSPSLSRSLSLDSMSTHNLPAPCISHQTSSLSLNDVNDLKESEKIHERRTESDMDFASREKYDEPEAVIVEVEDDIIETAAPLFSVLPLAERQTPVYKYQSDSCSDICNNQIKSIGRPSIQHNTLEKIGNITSYLSDRKVNNEDNIRYLKTVLESLRTSYPELERNIRERSPAAKEAFSEIKHLVNDLLEMLKCIEADEACSQELISERFSILDSKLNHLHKVICLVYRHIKARKQFQDQLPEINITSDDGIKRNIAIVSVSPKVFQSEIVVNQTRVLKGEPFCNKTTNLEASDDLSASQNEIVEDGCLRKINRNSSNGSKKKLRLRKMGSRQNSKTDSGSSDEEGINILETPRRIKRKTSRAKQKSFEEDKKLSVEKNDNNYDDIVYVLTVQPGQIIQQQEITTSNGVEKNKSLILPTGSSIPSLEGTPDNLSTSANVFVKTKRKMFAAVEESGTSEGLPVIVKDLESFDPSDENKTNCIQSTPQSPTFKRESENVLNQLTASKEMSPAIKIMIAKYNEKLESKKSLCSSGTCTPVGMRSPILDRRVKKQTTHFEELGKSASAGNIANVLGLTVVEITDENVFQERNRLSKSCSADTFPIDWKIESIPTENNVNGHSDSESSIESQASSHPLAYDSLRGINKSGTIFQKDITTKENCQKKQHLYRKNKDKPTSLSWKSGVTVKKIEMKNAKTIFDWEKPKTIEHTDLGTPDRSDNTIPKIHRKLERNSFTPTDKAKNFDIYYPYASAPVTPMGEIPHDRPKTPLTERALKIQKAKEEFLRGSFPRVPMRRDDPTKPESWKNRLSQMSMSSETNVSEEGELLKSASVGMIGPNNESSNDYDSLPRNVVRSSKITSKLGFANLASKFRKVKMRRTSKDHQSTVKMNTVSELCRQSLIVDLKPTEATTPPKSIGLSSSIRNLSKSNSSQASLGGLSTLFKKSNGENKEKLNKSKSAGGVPNQKESNV